MKITTLFLSSLALCAGLSLSGCKSGNACDKLADKLCDGKDDATCKKIKTWLDSEMTGPNKEKLSSDQASLGCSMILDDKDALEAYKKEAETKAK